MVSLAAILGLLSTMGAPAEELQNSATFRAVSKRVYVDVFVSKNERSVFGLTEKDFAVRDSGVVESEFTLLDGADQPLSIVLLLDTSRSVRGSKLQQLRVGAATFIDALFESDDVAVIGFGSRFQLLSTAADGFDEAKRAVRRMSQGGATALFDSLDAAITLAERGGGRPLVVAFTDGSDNSSWLTSTDAIDAAKRSSAVIFALQLTSGAGMHLSDSDSQQVVFFETESDRLAHETLQEITRAGGGELVTLRSSDSLPAGFSAILEKMRHRYLIVYEPSSKDPGWHSIEVSVKGRDDVVVRARAGYYMY